MREWYFFPIVMPLNAEGQGPARDGEIVSTITWEVWNQDLESLSSHEFLADAVDEAIRLNEEKGWN